LKKIYAPRLLVVLLLTACGGTQSTSPSPTATVAATAPATVASSIPKPDADQEKELLTQLGAISLALNNAKSVSNSRNTCTSILGGSDDSKLVAATKTRFTGGDVNEVTDEQARQILAVVKSNGFCK
jgi:hypothetical protein